MGKRVLENPKPEAHPKKARNKMAKTLVKEMTYTINYRKPDRSPGSYTVRLSVPSPEEECPLTLDSISTSGVDFLPGVTFVRKFPDLKKMTLPCGHSFSAMALFYHMCKNNQLCPCCRQGEEGAICIESIPAHFRKEAMERIKALTEKEDEQDAQEEMYQVLAIESYAWSFEDMANRGDLSLLLEFASNAETRPTPATIVLSVLLAPSGNSVFRPLFSQRVLLSQLRNISDTVAVTVQMRIPGVGTAQLETTAPQDMRGATRSESVRGVSRGTWVSIRRDDPEFQSMSTFDMDFETRDGESFLRDIAWRPDSPFVRWMVAQP